MRPSAQLTFCNRLKQSEDDAGPDPGATSRIASKPLSKMKKAAQSGGPFA